MNEANFFFRGQMADEEIIAVSRKHWIAVLPDVIQFFLYIIAAVAFAVVVLPIIPWPPSDNYYQMVFAGFIILSGYVTHRFFLHLINYFTNIVIITNFRVIDMMKTLFIHDTKDAIAIKQILDVNYKQEGLLTNLLKFGNLHLAIGNNETKILTWLPNPDFHYRLINRIINEPFVRKHGSIKNPGETMRADLGLGARGMPNTVSEEDTKTGV